MTVSRDDVDTQVDVDFAEPVQYQDMTQLVAAIKTKLEGGALSVSNLGSRLTFHLNNGRARMVEIKEFPTLGFTAEQSPTRLTAW